MPFICSLGITIHICCPPLDSFLSRASSSSSGSSSTFVLSPRLSFLNFQGPARLLFGTEPGRGEGGPQGRVTSENCLTQPSKVRTVMVLTLSLSCLSHGTPSHPYNFSNCLVLISGRDPSLPDFLPRFLGLGHQLFIVRNLLLLCAAHFKGDTMLLFLFHPFALMVVCQSLPSGPQPMVLTLS